jgi:hypothetical protein
MSRLTSPLIAFAVVATSISHALAADPSLAGVDTFLPSPQSSLSGSSLKSAFSPIALPDLHLSTPTKPAPSIAASTASLPVFATAQVNWSGRSTATHGSTPTIDLQLDATQRNVATPSVSLPGITVSAAPPATNAAITPSPLRDRSATFSPSNTLFTPPASYLDSPHAYLAR